MAEDFSGGTKSLKDGLSKDCAYFPDKSTGLKGPSVDTRAKREGVAKSPKTLGPRKTGM